MKARLVDLELMVHHVTDRAVLVSTDGDEAGAVWLPKSRIELEEEPVAGQAQIVTMPEVLAIGRELV
jgi:hypothetical protein